MDDTLKANRLRKREPKKSGVFTDKFIKSLKPDTEMYQVREGRGFAIRVLPSGVKTWYYIYKFQGKRRQLNLGNYPDVTLEKAHEKYLLAVARVKDGENPVAPPPEPPQTTPDQLTVAALAKLWLDWAKQHHTTRVSYNNMKALESGVLPQYGYRLAAEIRRRDAVAILETKAATAPGQANNLHKALRGMYQYAVERELLDYNPFSDIRAARTIPAMKQEARERVLSDDEIKYLWKAIDQGGGSDSTRRALKLMLATGQRNNEVCGMHTNEIQVGVGKPRCQQCRRCGWWIIPKERRQGNKGGKHRIFLSPLAMDIIGEHVGHILPGETDDKPIHGNSVNYHVRRNVEATGKTPYYGLPRWTPHDLRRTCATGVRRLGATRDDMDLILGHKVAGITGVYDRYSGDQEKIKWLTAWGEYLRGILMPG